MPIAPIVGRLRKHIIADISIALGLGASAGYLFWYGVHIPQMKRRDNYYLKLEKS